MKKFKTEPSADNRIAAKAIYGMFVALIDEGFSEQQALNIVGQMLANVAAQEDQ